MAQKSWLLGGSAREPLGAASRTLARSVPPPSARTMAWGEAKRPVHHLTQPAPGGRETATANAVWITVRRQRNVEPLRVQMLLSHTIADLKERIAELGTPKDEQR